jgi:gluconate kinase
VNTWVFTKALTQNDEIGYIVDKYKGENRIYLGDVQGSLYRALLTMAGHFMPGDIIDTQWAQEEILFNRQDYNGKVSVTFTQPPTWILKPRMLPKN